MTILPQLQAFFAGHDPLRAVIDMVLAGEFGEIALDAEVAPRAARLSLGCYQIFGGDPSAAGARALVAGATSPRELMYGNDPGWRQLILEVYADRAGDRPMRSYRGAGLDAPRLRSIAASSPVGFFVGAMDVGMARQLDHRLAPHALQAFPDPESFVRHGLGVGILHQGQLVCAASSYAISPLALEVAIATREDFRGRGLAAAASAGLLLAASDSGRVPYWNASNPVSQRLASRLGLESRGTCEILLLA